MVTPEGSSQKENEDEKSLLILCLFPAGDGRSIFTVCPSIPPGSFVKLFILGSEALDSISALFLWICIKTNKTFQLRATSGIEITMDVFHVVTHTFFSIWDASGAAL